MKKAILLFLTLVTIMCLNSCGAYNEKLASERVDEFVIALEESGVDVIEIKLR